MKKWQEMEEGRRMDFVRRKAGWMRAEKVFSSRVTVVMIFYLSGGWNGTDGWNTGKFSIFFTVGDL